MHVERALRLAHEREYALTEGEGKQKRHLTMLDGSNAHFAGGGGKRQRRKGNSFLEMDRERDGGDDHDDLQREAAYACSFKGAQVEGVGVAGGAASGGSAEAMAQCDIAMPTDHEQYDWHLRPIVTDTTVGEREREGKSHRYTIGPHSISFEPGLSVLSKEHPARVWNSLIYSLALEYRPKVEYEYTPVMNDEGGELTGSCVRFGQTRQLTDR